MRRLAACLSSALIAMVLTAAPASAADVSVASSTITYNAAVGETNNLVVTLSGTDYLFDDTVAITALAGCTQSGDNALCPSGAPNAIDVNLLDQDDAFNTDVMTDLWRIQGGSGADTLDGSKASNFLRGEAGDDTLIGDTGSDYLVGGAGSDTMDGGAGSDIADYYDETTARPGAVNVSLDGVRNDGDPSATAYDGAAKDLISNVEGIYGSNGADTLTGDGNANSLDGNGGGDVMNGLAGSDFLNGRDGDDTLNGGDDGDVFYGGAGGDAFNGGAGLDSLSYGLDGRPSGVTVTVDGVKNDGDPTAAAFDGTGDNVGTDIETVNGSFYADVITGGPSFMTISAGSGNDTLNGGTGGGYLGGDDGDDTLNGGTNVDYLRGGRGADQLNGGDGTFDTADYSVDGRSAGVTVTLDGVQNDGDQSAGNYDGAARDRVGTDVEFVYGTPNADTITGDSGPNQVLANGGNDTVNGGGGSDDLQGLAGDDALFGGPDGAYDKLNGGTGADRYDVDASGNSVDDPGIDRVFYNDFRHSPAVTVTLGNGAADDGNSDDGPAGARDNVGPEVESITGTSGIDVITGSGTFNNTISGGGGNDTLDGGPGADFLAGGLGNDGLAGGLGSDRVTYHLAGTGYTTSSGVKVTEDGLPNDGVIATAEADNVANDVEYLFGSDGPDNLSLAGYAGGNPSNPPATAGVVLAGFLGDDILTGTTGSDYFDGGGGNDTANCLGGTDIRVSIEMPVGC